MASSTNTIENMTIHQGIYGTETPIPSANAAALDPVLVVPSPEADANAAAEEPEYITVMAI